MKLFSYFYFLVIIFLLQGCLTATVISTAAIGTKIAHDPRSIGTQIDDSTLTLRVKNAIKKNKQINKISHINLIVYQGKVLIVGQLPNEKLISRVENIVMNVKGVNEVFNEIRQKEPISFYNMLSDAWITMKIRSRILIQEGLKSFLFKMITEDREVFLMGLATKKEGNIAANIASQINGVKRVITAFSCSN